MKPKFTKKSPMQSKELASQQANQATTATQARNKDVLGQGHGQCAWAMAQKKLKNLKKGALLPKPEAWAVCLVW